MCYYQQDGKKIQKKGADTKKLFMSHVSISLLYFFKQGVPRITGSSGEAPYILGAFALFDYLLPISLRKDRNPPS